MLKKGSTEMSVRIVCDEADISRGTFYRYFNSKEDLLLAFSRYMRQKFESKIIEIVEGSTHPDERFELYLRCAWLYLNADNARRLFEIEPDFSVRDFRNNFQNSIERTQHVLESTFTHWEHSIGARIDRKLLSEMLIRYMLSELIVPSEGNWEDLLKRITAMVAGIWPREALAM